METIKHKFHWMGRPFESEVLIHLEKIGELTLICFEDIEKGTSVTNASEQLATEIVQLKELSPGKCLFYEYYSYKGEEADMVFYHWEGNKAISPFWMPLKKLDNLFWK